MSHFLAFCLPLTLEENFDLSKIFFNPYCKHVSLKPLLMNYLKIGLFSPLLFWLGHSDNVLMNG